MSILSAQSIRASYMISPFMERTVQFGMTCGCGPSSYDIRSLSKVRMEPGDFVLIGAIEYFIMPLNVQGQVKDKSSWVRRGLTVQNTILDPGWKGNLTLELKNIGREILYINDGMPIAQVVFYWLDKPTDTPYNGKYMNQAPGGIPAILEDDNGNR